MPMQQRGQAQRIAVTPYLPNHRYLNAQADPGWFSRKQIDNFQLRSWLNVTQLPHIENKSIIRVI
jgi:hypothetical protein